MPPWTLSAAPRYGRSATTEPAADMGVRKDQATLTPLERAAFVNAVLEFKRRGGYDELVRIHLARMTADWDTRPRAAHRAPSFLPWHRRYLLEFERGLQAIDPTVTLPYWNWTADKSPTGALWGPDFLGGDGRTSDGQVMTGPFAYCGGRWPITVSVDNRPYLTRAFGAIGVALPTVSGVNSVIAINEYDSAPWNSSSLTGFRVFMEGFRGPDLHNRVHGWVGGTMNTAVSPNDPAFFLHHAYLDKIWTQWRAAHPGSPYLPSATTTNVVAATEPIPPWNDMCPQDLEDATKWYTYDR